MMTRRPPAASRAQPGAQRPTTRREVVKGKVWVLEQTQGVLDVIVNVRMTVVRLQDGGLFVYAPVAPTQECRRLVDELGDVRYVVLPTTAVEHKVFFGPFAKAYPEAECYSVPGQWSFPINLPLAALGLFPRKLTGRLTGDDQDELPWAGELDYALLDTPLGLGPYVEAAFYHRATKTLLVTDIVCQVPAEPPEVCEVDASPLLYRAKNGRADVVTDSRADRLKGWGKTVLFALFFKPETVDFQPLKGFLWDDAWSSSFDVLRRENLIVPPILQALVLTKRPKLLRAWVDQICAWDFQRIVPCHFTAPIKAGPREFRAAFAFDGSGVAEEEERGGGLLPAFLRPKRAAAAPAEEGSAYKPAYKPGDMLVLELIDQLVTATGVIKKEDA